MKEILRKIAERMVQATATMKNLTQQCAQMNARLQSTEDRLTYLEAVVEHLFYEKVRMASRLRALLGPVADSATASCQVTKSSFDWQWDELSEGKHLPNDPVFRKEAINLVLTYTQLAREWFQGKKVADVGCGTGRFSWALGQLGAEVLSIDQSEHALDKAKALCTGHLKHRILQADLLQKLPVDERFDLVWCYGVLHHTGDSYRAFLHTDALVKPGGWLFLMIYGEPQWGKISHFKELALYDRLRKATQNKTFHEKVESIRQAMRAGEIPVQGEEFVHGYFDVISPLINDLYTWQEIEAWLMNSGYENIKRTLDSRNLHVIAHKGNALY